MIINNENEKLSRNRKRITERKIKKNNKMNLFLNKFILEEKNKYKIIERIKQLEIELPEMKYVNNPNSLEFKLNELHELQVVDEKLHETKNEIIGDYAGEFEVA